MDRSCSNCNKKYELCGNTKNFHCNLWEAKVEQIQMTEEKAIEMLKVYESGKEYKGGISALKQEG